MHFYNYIASYLALNFIFADLGLGAGPTQLKLVDGHHNGRIYVEGENLYLHMNIYITHATKITVFAIGIISYACTHSMLGLSCIALAIYLCIAIYPAT